MNNNIKTFLLVSETKNISKTAQLLNYSQSTVSNQIHKLEQELDVKLFHRKKYGVELTEEGKIYIRYANQIINSSREFDRELRGLKDKKENLIVSIQESQYIYKYAYKISEWLSQNKNVNLIFKSAHSNFHIKEQISNFEMDICLLTDEKIIPNTLDVKHIASEKLVLVSKREIDFKDFNDIKNHILLVTEKGCSYREQFERFMYNTEISPRQTIEFIGIESLKKHLLNFGGIALLPYFIVEKELSTKKLYEISMDYIFNDLDTYVLYNSKSENSVISSFITQVFL